jgi:hypothetical protein
MTNNEDGKGVEGDMDDKTEFLLRAVATQAREACDALAHRWVMVDCNPREEKAIRFLNDALHLLDCAEAGEGIADSTRLSIEQDGPDNLKQALSVADGMPQ